MKELRRRQQADPAYVPTETDRLRAQIRDVRVLAIVVGVIAIGGIVGGIVSVVLNAQRRDQSCASDERADLREIVQLRQTYRVLSDRVQRSRLEHGLVVTVVANLPEQERQARTNQAPSFCKGDVGLDEAEFPKLPPRRSFAFLLSPAEREQIRQQRKKANPLGSGSSGETGSAPDRRQQARVRPQPRAGGQDTLRGPQGGRGPQGRSGGQGPQGPPAQPGSPAQTTPAPGPIRSIVDQVGETVNQLLHQLP